MMVTGERWEWSKLWAKPSQASKQIRAKLSHDEPWVNQLKPVLFWRVKNSHWRFECNSVWMGLFLEDPDILKHRPTTTRQLSSLVDSITSSLINKPSWVEFKSSQLAQPVVILYAYENAKPPSLRTIHHNTQTRVIVLRTLLYYQTHHQYLQWCLEWAPTVSMIYPLAVSRKMDYWILIQTWSKKE